MYLEWTCKGRAERRGFLSVADFTKNSTYQEKGKSVGLLALCSLCFKAICVPLHKQYSNDSEHSRLFLVAHWLLLSVVFDRRAWHLCMFCWELESITAEAILLPIRGLSTAWLFWSYLVGSVALESPLNAWICDFCTGFCVFVFTKSMVSGEM